MFYLYMQMIIAKHDPKMGLMFFILILKWNITQTFLWDSFKDDMKPNRIHCQNLGFCFERKSEKVINTKDLK